MNSSDKGSQVGRWNIAGRITFCLFWISMYAAVIFSRLTTTHSSLIQDPAIINEFDVGKVSQMLTTLLLISAFLERAIEVYVLTFRKQQEVKIDLDIRRLKLSLLLVDKLDVNGQGFDKEIKEIVEIFPIEDKDLEEILNGIDNAADKDKVKMIIQEKINVIINDKDNHINNYKSTTRSYTLWSALLLGILISLIGIRGLGTFTTLGSGNEWGNNWFKVFDILLTGAVIAGGSDIIHQILQVVTTFMDAISTSNKAVAAANGIKP